MVKKMLFILLLMPISNCQAKLGFGAPQINPNLVQSAGICAELANAGKSYKYEEAIETFLGERTRYWEYAYGRGYGLGFLERDTKNISTDDPEKSEALLEEQAMNLYFDEFQCDSVILKLGV
ncbi:hypothetical protein A6E12_08275 [Aliivibrio fischeri]|uniref:hypothetical protein n=1 Tax=Aliivibrio fischeri TaxID=668 RepID=UPI00080EA061|nr:hypothetical protein [Aliivibrio fischeri]OCH29015.1 hypothetical protein A6E12_08275 [Aliivibrio fischeri]